MFLEVRASVPGRSLPTSFLAMFPVFTASRLLISIIILFTVLGHPVNASTDGHSEAGQRSFTVKDSIEMTRFGRLDYEPAFSPNGEYFAILTSRGLIESNKVESTLRVFTTKAVKEYMGKANATPPDPRILATLTASPTRQFSSAYGSMISNLKWAPDSKALLFLGQNSSGKRQLYQADLDGGVTRALTSIDQDVSQFDLARGTIVYRVTAFENSSEKGETINADARAVTGLPIPSVLFPQERRSDHSTLWIRQLSKNHPVIDPTTSLPFQLWDEPPVTWNALSVSSDGNFVAVLLPAITVPTSWERYVARYEHLRIDPSNPTLTADSNSGRLTQYAVVNLKTGRVTVLVNAPNGWALGWGDRNRAIWSVDGNELLLTNTFLPLESVGHDEMLRRIRPCAAAVVKLSSLDVSCVSYEHEKPVWDGTFGESSNDVILQLGEHSGGEQFHFTQGSWQAAVSTNSKNPVGTPDCASSRQNLSPGLLVRVAQDLNNPPVLQATDCEKVRTRTIWNPNPQLEKINLGEASIVHWTDSNGYEWRGALLKPPDYVPTRRYPVVLQTYGFLENEFLTDGLDTTAFAARPLAAAGMIVLQFWARFDHAGKPQDAPDQIRGYESAIKKLAFEGLADPERIGIIGFSHTCYHVESALIMNPKLFAAATIADGADESYVQHVVFFSVDDTHLDEPVYGDMPFGKGFSKWIDQAPGFHLHQLQTPLRIEAIGPLGLLAQAETYASLWEQKKPVDLIYIPNGQHILQKPLDRMASQQGNVDWFRFWLQGYEDPDALKAKQYVRWRLLRDDCSKQTAHTSMRMP